jgi:hypothetical protein
MKNTAKLIALAVSVLGLLMGGVAEKARAELILDIKAAYDISDYTYFIIENQSGAPITGITLSGLGTSGSIAGSTGSLRNYLNTAKLP